MDVQALSPAMSSVPRAISLRGADRVEFIASPVVRSMSFPWSFANSEVPPRCGRCERHY